MDNLTHTLAGAALAQAGLKGKTRLGMATLLVGANLPDVDVLAIPFGHSLDFRRGWTHGVLALAVLPLVLAAGMLAWDRWVRLRREPDAASADVRWLVALAFIGILSHPTLDWLNTYGLRWQMPFSGTWFYGDALFIIDPWVWLVLGVGVAVSRRMERNGRPGAPAPARVAVAAVALYMAAMVASSAAAERWTAARLRDHGIAEALSVLASPVPLNPLRREIVVETGAAYHFGTFRWRPAPELRLTGETAARGDGHPAVARAAAEPEMRQFLVWSRYPFFRVEEAAGGAWVSVADARYSRGPRAGWASLMTWVAEPTTAR